MCHAAIITLGYSAGLGFIHTGKALSFVYDIADLYKANVSIPAAFEAVAKKGGDIEREVRVATRRYLKQQNVLKQIALDIEWIFDVANDIKPENEDINCDEVGDL